LFLFSGKKEKENHEMVAELQLRGRAVQAKHCFFFPEKKKKRLFLFCGKKEEVTLQKKRLIPVIFQITGINQ
jgi:hypothetical protein